MISFLIASTLVATAAGVPLYLAGMAVRLLRARKRRHQ